MDTMWGIPSQEFLAINKGERLKCDKHASIVTLCAHNVFILCVLNLFETLLIVHNKLQQ
jgi:hypothetical protein